MTPRYHMYKDKHMVKFKRVMRHIKLILNEQEIILDAF
jgi:hypothetical protein